MKQLLSFIKKEVLHIIRDKRTILILLIMPVVQIMLFGFAMTLEVKNIRVAVSYQYGDELAEKITARISASEYFDIVKTINNPINISSYFIKEKIDTIIVFSDGFSNEIYKGGTPAVQIINDASDPNQASTVTSYISAIISSFQNEIAGIPPLYISFENPSLNTIIVSIFSLLKILEISEILLLVFTISKYSLALILAVIFSANSSPY